MKGETIIPLDAIKHYNKKLHNIFGKKLAKQSNKIIQSEIIERIKNLYLNSDLREVEYDLKQSLDQSNFFFL
jgi:hypothetical protein